MSNSIAMPIDPRKVSLAEKDIEDWLYENPAAIEIRGAPIKQWIGRQYRLPSGIADLIGVTDGTLGSPEELVVIEIKNVEIGKSAVLQVCRYADDLKMIMGMRMDCPRWADREPIVRAVLIGPSIDDQTFREAIACRVAVRTFAVSMQLQLSTLSWSDQYRDQLDREYERIARQPEWERYGVHLSDHVEQMMDEYHVADELDDEVSGTLGTV